mmetsp:Transcript_73725/g.140351  ORF Transcript_73725/g.140351 Transcript_73725/m.140351 type:complete len:204 (+) Transcript_73725:1092-1703(+)
MPDALICWQCKPASANAGKTDAFRRQWISLESAAMASVERVASRCPSMALTQKMSAMPQPGRRYSHKHLHITLCRRSDSFKLFVCSLRSRRFKEESEMLRSRVDLRPWSEGFSYSFSAPARSTRVNAPTLTSSLAAPSRLASPTVSMQFDCEVTLATGFCTKICTIACDLDEEVLHEDVPVERFSQAVLNNSRQVDKQETWTI